MQKKQFSFTPEFFSIADKAWPKHTSLWWKLKVLSQLMLSTLQLINFTIKVVLWNHSYSWVPMFVDGHIFAGREDVISLETSLLQIARQFIILLNISGDVNSWVRVIHKIQELWSPTNKLLRWGSSHWSSLSSLKGQPCSNLPTEF